MYLWKAETLNERKVTHSIWTFAHLRMAGHHRLSQYDPNAFLIINNRQFQTKKINKYLDIRMFPNCEKRRKNNKQNKHTKISSLLAFKFSS